MLRFDVSEARKFPGPSRRRRCFLLVAGALENGEARILREVRVALVKEAEAEYRAPYRTDRFSVKAILAEAGRRRLQWAAGGMDAAAPVRGTSTAAPSMRPLRRSS